MTEKTIRPDKAVVRELLIVEEGFQPHHKIIVELWHQNSVGYGEVPSVDLPGYAAQTTAEALRCLTSDWLKNVFADHLNLEALDNFLESRDCLYPAQAAVSMAMHHLNTKPQSEKFSVPVTKFFDVNTCSVEDISAIEKTRIFARAKVRTIEDIRKGLALFKDFKGILFDANQSFFLSQVHALNEVLPSTVIIEEAFSYNSFEELRATLPLCTFRYGFDESLRGVALVEKFSRHFPEAIFTLKLAHLGSYTAFKRAVSLLNNSQSLWRAAGMFDTGIGRHALLALVAKQEPAMIAHDLGPATEYMARDLLLSPIVREAERAICEAPASVDVRLLEKYTVQINEIKL